MKKVKTKSSTEDIRQILMNELDSLIKGNSDTKRATAVAKISAQAIYATRVELENKRIEVDIGKNLGKVRWDNIDGKETSIPFIKMTGE